MMNLLQNVDTNLRWFW